MPTAKRRVALISVSEKKNPDIIEFAKKLRELNFRILASGGTAKTLKDAGIPVTDVAKLVGGKAILGHRVVTISRELAAALLARYNHEDDLVEMAKLGLPYMDLVCCDFYALEKKVAEVGSKSDLDESQKLAAVTEATDIGGPNMVRAAAKGQRIVICDPNDRDRVLKWLEDGEPNRDAFMRQLAAKAEATVAKYALSSAGYLGDWAGLIGHAIIRCCYGENRYQSPATVYATDTTDPLAIANFRQVLGTAPSYNNITDLDRGLQTISHISETLSENHFGDKRIAIAMKHGNACGVGVANEPRIALTRMIEGDLLAILGAVVITNFPLDKLLCEYLINYKMDGERRMLDCIIAPDVSNDSLEVLERKRDKCRVLINPALLHPTLDPNPIVRPVRGGFITQPNYSYIANLRSSEMRWYGRPPSEAELMDVAIAKAICDTSNSNTITIVKYGQLVGNGVGQQARVYGSELAVLRAQWSCFDLEGAVAASDSFFPETDGVEALVEAGIKVIFATAGGLKKMQVINYCIEQDVTLILIPDAIGRGFFRH
jgi:phosphoribosylaminoimidazolecarboxamide formyltransferase/IMP cyclohydrolase